MTKQFYILSLKHTRGDYIVWWGPNNGGYSTVLDKAGLYSEEEVNAQQDYYNNGESTMAIPEEEVLREVRRVVSTDALSRLCKQHVYQTKDGAQTQAVFDRETEREKKRVKDLNQRIEAEHKRAGGKCHHLPACDGHEYDHEDADVVPFRHLPGEGDI